MKPYSVFLYFSTFNNYLEGEFVYYKTDDNKFAVSIDY